MVSDNDPNQDTATLVCANLSSSCKDRKPLVVLHGLPYNSVVL